MLDMMKMMGKIKEAQKKVKEAQNQLESITAQGTSGGEMVEVTANGQKKILHIKIDDSLVNQDDKEMMQDLIVAACNDALEKVMEKSQKHIQNATEGLLPNIPGINFEQMMK